MKHLVSATDLRLTLHVDNTSKLHEAVMIKDVTNAKVVAIASKIVPLVHVNAIPLIGNNLETQ